MIDTNERLAKLRMLVTSEPSHATWQEICLLFNTWPRDSLEVALDLAVPHLDERWPDDLRAAPPDWSLARGMGHWPRGWPLVKGMCVYLTGWTQKIQTIKAIRELTGLGLKDSKELVESAPSFPPPTPGGKALAEAYQYEETLHIKLKGKPLTEGEYALVRVAGSIGEADEIIQKLKEAGAYARKESVPHDKDLRAWPPFGGSGEFMVKLIDHGPKKIQVIKKVREHLAFGLRETKTLVESAPVVLLKTTELNGASSFYSDLCAAGAHAALLDEDADLYPTTEGRELSNGERVLLVRSVPGHHRGCLYSVAWRSGLGDQILASDLEYTQANELVIALHKASTSGHYFISKFPQRGNMTAGYGHG